MIKKIGDTFFGTLIITLLLVFAYLCTSLLMSATMLNASYFLFTMWPPYIRFAYTLIGMYLMFNGVSDDLSKIRRGTR